MTPKELYRERITELTAEIKQLNKYNHLMVILELLAVALAVICVVFYTTWDGGIVSLIGAVLSIALYIAIRWKDSKNSRLSVEKESMCNVYQKELDEITYTYRLSEGVARNQNATYLLKNILKKAFIRT